jgi:hypothetical protein
MLFGWRLWKACIFLCFGIIGAGVIWLLAESRRLDPDPFTLIVAAAAAGFVSHHFAHHAVPVLGGLLGAGLAANTAMGFNFDGPPYGILTGLGVLGGGALAFINRRYLMIGLTSLIGAVLAVSGVCAFLMTQSGLFATLQSLATDSAIVAPFVILVPTVMSFFYQVSEVRRMQAEL